jgi:arylsulfatase A-like enzyme
MSGQYTPRHGIYTVVDPRQPPGSPWHRLVAAHSESELATEVVTLPESLKAAGYATGFFGMWNLGRGRTGPVTPGGQGFDTVVFPETIGFGKDEYFDDKGNYLSDRLTDEVLAFVEKHRDRPFFAYYPDHAVHAPFNPKPDLLAKYERKAKAGGDGRNDPAYAATIEAVDQNVGRIMAGLEKLRLVDDTIVIFTSDNGGTQQYTAPLSGSKGQLYEGGIGRATPSSAVREGDSTLIEFFEDGGRTELYDLRDDPNEKRDLAKSQPGRVAALSRTLHQWQQATGAAIPRDANPAYAPKADRPRGGQPGGGQRPGQKQGQGGKGSGGKPADAGKGPEKGGRKSMRQESPPRTVHAG